MAIKKIEFRNIKSLGNISTFAMGGVRIDTLNGFLKTEYNLKTSNSIVETQPCIFKVTRKTRNKIVTLGNLTRSVISSENGVITSQLHGWFGTQSNTTVISITFKKPLEYVKGISFVPMPSNIDVGGVSSFDIFYYSPNGSLVKTHTFKLGNGVTRNQIVYINSDLLSGVDGQITIDSSNNFVLVDRNSKHKVNFSIRPPLRGEAKKEIIKMTNLGYTPIGTYYKALIPYENYGYMFNFNLKENTMKDLMVTEIEQPTYFLIKYKGVFYTYKNEWVTVNLNNDYDFYNFVLHSITSLSDITEKEWGKLVKDDFEVYMIIADLQGINYSTDGNITQRVPSFNKYKKIGRVLSSSHVSNNKNKYLNGNVFLSGFDKVWRTTRGNNTNQFVGYRFTSRVIINAFSITIKDNISTSPKDIIFMARNNENEDWVILHLENGLYWSNTRQTKIFEVMNSTPYQSYRLFIKSVYGGEFVELAEFRMAIPSMLDIMTPAMVSNTSPSTEGVVRQYRLSSAGSGFRFFDLLNSTKVSFNLSSSSIRDYGYPFIEFDFKNNKNLFCYAVANIDEFRNVTEFQLWGGIENNGSIQYYLIDTRKVNYDNDRIDNRFHYITETLTLTNYKYIRFVPISPLGGNAGARELTLYQLKGHSNRDRFIEVIYKDFSPYTYKVEITKPYLKLLKEVTETNTKKIDDYIELDKDSFIDGTEHTITVTAIPLIPNYDAGDFNYFNSTTRVIYNNPPKIQASVTNLDLKIKVTDNESDNFNVSIKLNNKDYDYFESNVKEVLYNKTFKSNELIVNNKDFISHNNIVEITATDRYKAKEVVRVSFAGVYRNLMFTDEHESFYTTDLGELIKYLDLGLVIKSTKTLPTEVFLINKLPYIVYDIQLYTTNNLPNNTTLGLSQTDTPFIPSNNIKIADSLKFNEKVSFFIRFDSFMDSVESIGDFKIHARGYQKTND